VPGIDNVGAVLPACAMTESLARSARFIELEMPIIMT
jgi:hypothetical protein